MVLFSVSLRLKRDNYGDANMESRSLVRKHWIEEQRNYFIGQPTLKIGKAYEHKLKAEKAERQVRAFLRLGFFLTFITLLVHYFNLDGHLLAAALRTADYPLGVWLNYLLLAATLSFGLSAGTAMYAEIQGHESRAASYLLTGQQFDAALSQYDAAYSDSQAQSAVVLEIGQEALAENANWLVTHRKITQSFINPY